MHEKIKKMNFVSKASIFVVCLTIGLILQHSIMEYFKIPQFGEPYLYGYTLAAIFLFALSRDGFFSNWLSFIITNMIALCVLMFIHVSYGKQIDHCSVRDNSKKCIDLRGWKTAPLSKQFQLIDKDNNKNEVSK